MLSVFAEYEHFLIYIFPPSRLADFAAGILVYRAYKHLKSISNAVATGLQIFSVSLLALFFLFKGGISQAARYDIYYLAPMCLLILSFAWQNGALSQLISGRVLVFLGEASFALYLIHQLVIRYGEHIRRSMLGYEGPQTELAFACAYLLTSLFGSAIIFAFFENQTKTYALNALRRWRQRRAGARAESGGVEIT